MAGLLDNEEDLDAYLRRLMTNTRTAGGGGNVGPVAVNFSQDYAANPQRALEVLGREPDVRAADVGYTHSFSPNMSARINAGISQQPGQDVAIRPGAQFNLGPLTLGGGANVQRIPGTPGEVNPETGEASPGTNSYTKVSPYFRAGINEVPLFGGRASVNASISPNEMKALEAAWRRQILGGRGDVGITGTYSQPTQGDPQWGVGVGGRIRF